MQSATQDLGSLIDKMAAKLSVPVAHLWEVLARQAKNEAISDFTTALIWLCVAGAVAYGISLLIRLADNEQAEYSERYKTFVEIKKASPYATPPTDPEAMEIRFWLRVGRFVLVGLCIIFAITGAVDGWKKLANPEYYALREVLSVLK